MEDPPSSPRPPVALYVHFPFCLSVCPYCDFVVLGGRAARTGGVIEAVVEALLVEIGLRGRAARRTFGEFPPLASVYLGGGTPSLLEPRQVARLLGAVDESFGLAADAEVTLEANPGRADRGRPGGFRAAGVNRLSIGAQSMHAGELRRLGRRHGGSDVAELVRLCRGAGFTNVSVDLLYDVPGQTLESWQLSLEQVLRLQPEHVSAYALTLDDPDQDGLSGATGDHLPLRRGARRWRGRARLEQDADLGAECYELADRLLGAGGLSWYELSNWAVAGRQSRHNLVYWQRRAHEAVGPGAHAFDGARSRRWNAAPLDGYLAALLPGDGRAARLPAGGSQLLDAAAARAEGVILGLRLSRGLPSSLAEAGEFAAGLSWGRASRLLEEVDGRLRLTMRGRLLGSELFWRLLPAR